MCLTPLYIKVSSPLEKRTGTTTRTCNGRISVSKSEVYSYMPSFVARPYRDGSYTMHFIDTKKVKTDNLVFASLEDAKTWLDGASYQPFRLIDGSYYIPVDCGKCEECLRKRKRRIQMLVKYDIKTTPYCENFMVTLSYDDRHLCVDTDRARYYLRGHNYEKVSRCPVSRLKDRPSCYGTSLYSPSNIYFNSLAAISHLKETPGDFVAPHCMASAGNHNYQHCSTGFLEYSHFSKFMKRLRITLQRWYDVTSIKFVACGEYGSDRTYISDSGYERQAKFRPHYHISLWFSRTDKCNGYYKEDYSAKRHRGKRSLFDQFLSLNGCKVPPLSESMMRAIVQNLWSDIGSSSKKYGVKVERARNREACGAYVCKYISKQLSSNKHTRCHANRLVPMFVRTSLLLADKWIDLLSNSLGEDKFTFKDTFLKDGKRVSVESFFPAAVLKRVAKKRNSNYYETLSYLVKRIDDIVASMSQQEHRKRSIYIKNSISADIAATSKNDD